MAEQTRLMDHILAVYDYMEKTSIDKSGDPIWEGKTTEVISALGLSNNYYTPIFRYLRGGNYLTQIKRGGGGSNSMYQLNGRPDPFEFDVVLSKTGASTTRNSKALQAAGNLYKEVEKLKRIVEQHTKILVTTQSALLDISQKVNGVGSDPFTPFVVPQVSEEELEEEFEDDSPSFDEPDFEGLKNGDV